MEGTAMKKNSYWQKMYKKSPITGNYIIEVSLNNYESILNDWDNAPFEKRNINCDLELFLESSSSHIPVKYGIDICFYVSKNVENKEKEKLVVSEIKTHYCFCLNNLENKLRQLYKKTFVYIAVSFILLLVAFLLESFMDGRVFYKIMFEGLNIGGWVFLWEAISLFFFKRSKISGKIKEYNRFLNANIFFKYYTLNQKSFAKTGF
jgi:hypothetical protein